MGNFWGDMDGDGKETPWDDMLGDMIMHDVYQAQERARRNEPPEDEDEDLLGYRRPGPYRRASTSAPMAGTAWLIVLGALLLMGACLTLMFR